jgi:hypothetical protein
MQMFSVNRLAELFQRDRSTLVRALRGIPRDGGTADRPKYTVATTSRALHDHFAAKSGRSEIDPALQARFDRLDALDAHVRAAPRLDARRALARELFPMLADVDRAMREDARRSGEDRELTGYRCEAHVRTVLATLRDPCGWSFEEILSEYNGAVEANQPKVI